MKLRTGFGVIAIERYLDQISETNQRGTQKLPFLGAHFSVVKNGCGTTLGNVFKMCQYENLAQNKQRNQCKYTERKNQR